MAQLAHWYFRRSRCGALKACEAIEHEAGEGLKGGLVDQLSELENSEAYLYKNLESDEDSSKDDWLEEDFKCEDSDTEATGSILHQSAPYAMQIQKQLTQRLYILSFAETQVLFHLQPLFYLQSSIWHVVHEAIAACPPVYYPDPLPGLIARLYQNRACLQCPAAVDVSLRRPALALALTDIVLKEPALAFCWLVA